MCSRIDHGDRMKVLVTGGTGLLGHHLIGAFSRAGYEVHATYHKARPTAEQFSWWQLDLEDLPSIASLVKQVKPEVIVQAAAYTDVDGCELNRQPAYRVNYLATQVLARTSLEVGARLIYISTDYVFDGNKGLYREEDEPNPVNYYGLTKLLGEVAVASLLPERGLVVRVSGLYGFSPTGKRNFGLIALEKLMKGEEVLAFSDQYLSPTYVYYLAEELVKAVNIGATGLLHLAGERVSRVDFTLALAELVGADSRLVKPVSICNARLTARRPRDSSLDTSRAASMGLSLPMLRICLEHFVRSYREWRVG